MITIELQRDHRNSLTYKEDGCCQIIVIFKYLFHKYWFWNFAYLSLIGFVITYYLCMWELLGVTPGYLEKAGFFFQQMAWFFEINRKLFRN